MIPKSVIFYLVNDNQVHLRRLYKSLDLLKENFLKKYPYPVVFGHEGLSQDVVDEIKIHAPENHYFYNVKFKIPDYPKEILEKIPEKFKGHWDEGAFFSIGYRHMCRFFAGDMYKHKFFENVKYFMRLDCDSYFTDVLDYDPFEQMVKYKRKYGYYGVENDMDYVIEGLYDKTTEFFGSNKTENRKNAMFQTHFEIVDIQWIKNSEYMKYYDFIEQTGNIYIKRWGDAPIKFQGLENILTQNDYFLFHDLPYRHGGDYN